MIFRQSSSIDIGGLSRPNPGALPRTPEFSALGIAGGTHPTKRAGAESLPYLQWPRGAPVGLHRCRTLRAGKENLIIVRLTCLHPSWRRGIHHE